MSAGVSLLLALAAAAAPGAPAGPIRFGVATSVADTGLLRVLLPPFENGRKVKVDVRAVTGDALALARDGDLDLVLVHDPDAERSFINDGYGARSAAIMRNYFLILGPAGDPAGVRNARSAVEAFRMIFGARPPFMSRGDGSATHARELALWHAGGLAPPGGAYLETGQDMERTLSAADAKEAYTLCDSATYASLRRKVRLKALYGRRESILANTYSAIAVDPGKHPDVRHEDALALIEWLTSPAGRKLIREFAVDGTRPFTPAADR